MVSLFDIAGFMENFAKLLLVQIILIILLIYFLDNWNKVQYNCYNSKRV